jgi:hypothetical protein
MSYVGAVGSAIQATPVAISDVASAGSTSGSVRVPSSTSSANSAPPNGTLYTAAMPAPAPHATSRRRCHSGSFAQSLTALATAAPACCGAASRPSDAPRATITIECTPRAMLDQNGTRAPRSQIASETSPGPRRASSSPPPPATTPPTSSTSTRRVEEVRFTPSRKSPE